MSFTKFTSDKICHSLVKTPAADAYRYRLNWFIIYSVTFLNGLSQLIQAPSLHQFITSSNNHSNPDIEPGLGLSETWYALAVSMVSVGTFIGAILFGIIARQVYFKPAIVVELMIALIGSLLYSFSNNGWLILISRFLTGLFAGLHMPLMRIYVLETSEKLILTLPKERQAKSTIKYTAMFMLFMHGTSGLFFGQIVVAIAAQIPSISDFHWPGYYMSIHSFVLIVLVIVAFDERWTDVTRRIKNNINAIQKLLKELRDPALPHYLSIAFIYLFLIFGWNLSILETLQNPILSDQFGLNIRSSSYVFIGVVSILFVSVIVVYVFQKLRIDNRHILLALFIIGITGTLTMTDWQSLRGDPCNQFNDNSTIDLSDDYNSTELNYYCEQFGDDNNYNCFWNPISRITGDYCERCRAVCLSETHSLNFVQLFIGITMISFFVVPGRVLTTTIASDKAGGHSQGIIMGGLIAAGALSQALGPLWTNSTYLSVGRHTWLPMLLLAGGQTIGLVLLLIFYKKIKKNISSTQYLTSEVSSNGKDTVELLVIEENTE